MDSLDWKIGQQESCVASCSRSRSRSCLFVPLLVPSQISTELAYFYCATLLAWRGAKGEEKSRLATSIDSWQPNIAEANGESLFCEKAACELLMECARRVAQLGCSGSGSGLVELGPVWPQRNAVLRKWFNVGPDSLSVLNSSGRAKSGREKRQIEPVAMCVVC